MNVSRDASSRSRSTGRSSASPRRPNGSSRGFSVHRVVTLGFAGNTEARGPAARPGTTTAAHCRPLAACTVVSVTALAPLGWPDSRPNSSASAAVR